MDERPLSYHRSIPESVSVSEPHLRHADPADVAAIQELYRVVAVTPGGIARTPEEVTRAYVEDFVRNSVERGIILVAEMPGVSGLAGELHTYRSELRVFSHVMGDLTVAVHPSAQGQGIGRQLFTRLLEEVTRDHPDVLRVELITQEGNRRALALYESVGFRREGRLVGRIRAENGFDDDVPMAWLRDTT
jgi:ribosomal protein S18 acetylase RimI-like enzyme